MAMGFEFRGSKGLRVWGSGLKVQGQGFRGSKGSRVWGSGLRV